MKYKIGDLVSVKAGVYIWSIDLQANVAFEKETIYKATNTSAVSGNVCFGKRCEILFNCPGMFPVLMETKNEFSIHPGIVSPYTMPTYQPLP